MIKTVLAYNQKRVRDGIKMKLDRYDEIHIIGEAEDGMQLIQLMLTAVPDVIVMDIKMPIIDGCEAIEIIKKTHPNIKVIILTNLYEEDYILKAIQNGADGYLLLRSNFDLTAAAIKSAYNGAMPIDPKVSVAIVKAFNRLAHANQSYTCADKLCKLTQRELDVAQLVAQGKNNKSISESLYIAEGTVKNYVTKILSKLELNSRTELAIYANETFKDSCAL